MARTTRPVGRPRDTTIDERVLDATGQLLTERGFEATTVQAIAERSGVHASAIYRRWPSRVEIMEQVVFPGLEQITVEPTGELEADLRRFIRSYAKMLAAPVARAAMPGLLAHYQNGAASKPPEAWLAVSARPQFRDILNAAPVGSVDEALDPDDVFDVILGALIGRSLVPTIAERGRPLERLVEMAMRLLAPTTPAAGVAS